MSSSVLTLEAGALASHASYQVVETLALHGKEVLGADEGVVPAGQATYHSLQAGQKQRCLLPAVHDRHRRNAAGIAQMQDRSGTARGLRGRRDDHRLSFLTFVTQFL